MGGALNTLIVIVIVIYFCFIVNVFLHIYLLVVCREQLECDLIFLGLLVLENRLKPETLPVIRTLKDADVRTIMVTGQVTV